jgi:hypothetical protein
MLNMASPTTATATAASDMLESQVGLRHSCQAGLCMRRRDGCVLDAASCRTGLQQSWSTGLWRMNCAGSNMLHTPCCVFCPPCTCLAEYLPHLLLFTLLTCKLCCCRGCTMLPGVASSHSCCRQRMMRQRWREAQRPEVSAGARLEASDSVCSRIWLCSCQQQQVVTRLSGMWQACGLLCAGAAA